MTNKSGESDEERKVKQLLFFVFSDIVLIGHHGGHDARGREISFLPEPHLGMNRGNIPGYYYDEVKKKYFKIQANHVAPLDAKYARSNVHREQAAEKKAKRVKREEAKRRQQTVTRAPIFKISTVAGCTLSRELGHLEPFALREHHVASAFVNGLQLASMHIDPAYAGQSAHGLSVTDAQYSPEMGNLTIACRLNNAASLLVVPFDGEWTSTLKGPMQAVAGGVTWEAPLIGLSTIIQDDGRVAFAACDQTGQLAIDFTSLDEWQDTRRSEQIIVYGLRMQTWAYKLQPVHQEKLVCAGTDNAFIYDLYAQEMSAIVQGGWSVTQEFECWAADWLNPQTLALGITETKTEPNVPMRLSQNVSHKLRLWDLRSRDRISRLYRPRRITGIHARAGNRGEIVVASPTDICLYDLRMVRVDQDPIYSFEHHALRTTADMAVTPNFDIVAALDSDGRMQTYSLRTGSFLRTLDSPPASPANRQQLTGVRWVDDGRQLYLQACHGQSICRWSWQDPDDF